MLFFIEIIHSQSIVINEVMSSNNNSFMDEFGEYPDWIEIYNGGLDLVNLSGFSLSDDRNNLSKFLFPPILIKPGSFHTVNASGRDIQSQAVAWNTIFTRGDNCKYFLGIAEPSENWNENIFNDTNWELGIGKYWNWLWRQ